MKQGKPKNVAKSKSVGMGDVVPAKMNRLMKQAVQQYHGTKGKKGAIINRALGGRFN